MGADSSAMGDSARFIADKSAPTKMPHDGGVHHISVIRTSTAVYVWGNCRRVFKQLMLKELGRRTEMDVESLTRIITPAPRKTIAIDQPPEVADTASDAYPEHYGEAPPNYDYSDYGDHSDYGDSPYPDQHQPRPNNRRRLKLSPLQRLILLLLHNPALCSEMAALNDLTPLNDPDALLLTGIRDLLEQNPHYTLNHVLGYWRGIHGAEQGETLARIVAADMLGNAGQTVRDDKAEFNDICLHIQKQLEASQSPRQQLETILANQDLSSADRKRISVLQSQLTKDEKSELYQRIKSALSKFSK